MSKPPEKRKTMGDWIEAFTEIRSTTDFRRVRQEYINKGVSPKIVDSNMAIGDYGMGRKDADRYTKILHQWKQEERVPYDERKENDCA